jgi:hypothetical protein
MSSKVSSPEGAQTFIPTGSGFPTQAKCIEVVERRSDSFLARHRRFSLLGELALPRRPRCRWPASSTRGPVWAYPQFATFASGRPAQEIYKTSDALAAGSGTAPC